MDQSTRDRRATRTRPARGEMAVAPDPSHAPEATPPEGGSPGEIARAIEAELAVTMGRPERVADLCARLDRFLGAPAAGAARAALDDTLLGLARRLRDRGGPIAEPVFTLLARHAAAPPASWPVLRELLQAHDSDHALRALAVAVQGARSGALPIDTALLADLATIAAGEGSPLRAPEALAAIRDLMDGAPPSARERPGTGALPGTGTPPGTGPRRRGALALFLADGPAALRRLAARVLDLPGEPAPPDVAAHLLGDAAHAFLAPYLAYTRAGHLDLLHLAPGRPGTGLAPEILDTFRAAAAACGDDLMREVLATLGWPRVCCGLDARRVVALAVGGSIPYLVRPEEAPLFDGVDGLRRAGESLLILAHGGTPIDSPAAGDAGGAASRFRALNLAHARLLAEIMEVAPLDRAKVGRLVALMDGAVAGFVALFSPWAEECAILPGLYRDLRERILAEMEREGDAPQISAELTRLVLAFEDPRTPGEVRTLHGLKRWLHQRGLHLGFRLVEAGHATNRTVDLLLCARGRIVHRVGGIEYVDFEPLPDGGPAPPYPVAVVAEGFARQLLHGQRSFPGVRIHCYGSEVHYYIGFGTHPAFLRIDLSPPLLGGMIDLEFYGVSKYEMAGHPDINLGALRRLFRRLEFDCSVDATHVHARYDKERALDLEDLDGRIEALFRLVPYLMDLDWIVGGLAIDPEARSLVAEAWAETFALWGALPLPLLLTRDRLGVLAAIEDGPAGPAEIAWSGAVPYRDRCRPFPPSSVFAAVRAPLVALGLEMPAGLGAGDAPVGQIALERGLLRTVRDAVERGEIVATPGGLRPCAAGDFALESAADRFAAILAGDDAALVTAAQVARLVATLEKGLRFRTMGDVNGHAVQQAPLVLRGERLGVHVLRDAAGIVRLALCSPGDRLWRRRDDATSRWSASPTLGPAALAPRLRAAGCLGAEAGPPATGPEDAASIRARFQGAGPARPRPPAPGERRAPGLAASPGRASGPARFGTTGRRPADLAGAILVTPSIRPEDSVFLYHCGGVVSTGGGILSHAGLIANQFHKPALIVGGEWRTGEGAALFAYRTLEFHQDDHEAHGYPVSVRRDIVEREHVMREGDLLVVDAGEGTLQVLGQERDALALHDGLRALAELDARLPQATEAAALLALRGRRLRALFQIERVLDRLDDPVLAVHAVDELVHADPSRPGPTGARAAALLARLLANPRVGAVARDALRHAAEELRRSARAALETAARLIPSSTSIDEIVALQRAAALRGEALRAASGTLASGGLAAAPGGGDTGMAAGGDAVAALARMARARLARLCDTLVASLADPGAPAPPRHALRRLDRIADLLFEPPHPGTVAARTRLAADDARAVEAAASRVALSAAECGRELHPCVGWKAANLAEVARLAGAGTVPAWFAVTDHAFRRVLGLPAPASPGASPAPVAGVASSGPVRAAATLASAIDAVLREPDLDAARKAARIRALWERVRIPDDLAAAFTAAYRGLETGDDGASPFVAVRSSALEEDTERVARAGEFDTFLFVRGEEALVEHVRRAWCGLWTERAIHHRALLGPGAPPAGGGVIVQRMVRARVAGVMQTINAAAGDFREMVINAGLGLGEGIVSGAVAADHIVVAKEGDLENAPLRFRYTVADKREQVVYDERTGIGTARVESRYHQRLRPALEYVELCELARTGARLEAAFGHPLDIEFAIEGPRLWVLQARPVAAPASTLIDAEEARP